MLDEIAFFLLRRALARRHSDDAFAAAPLCTERANGRALNEATVRNADDATLISDEIFHVDLAFVGHELGQTRAAMLVADFAPLFLNDGEDALLLRQNVA